MSYNSINLSPQFKGVDCGSAWTYMQELPQEFIFLPSNPMLVNLQQLTIEFGK